MRNQAIRNVFYWLTFSFLLVFISYGCNPEYEKLKSYYRRNAAMHAEVSDSLINFCRYNHTDVILRKSHFKESAIAFRILFASENTYYPIFYDSALNRHDPYPEKTLNYAIPLSAVKKFNESIYSAIAADSTQTFFGNKWDVKLRPGTQADLQYGILLSSDTSVIRNGIINLSPNACITKGTIP